MAEITKHTLAKGRHATLGFRGRRGRVTDRASARGINLGRGRRRSGFDCQGRGRSWLLRRQSVRGRRWLRLRYEVKSQPTGKDTTTHGMRAGRQLTRLPNPPTLSLLNNPNPSLALPLELDGAAGAAPAETTRPKGAIMALASLPAPGPPGPPPMGKLGRRARLEAGGDVPATAAVDAVVEAGPP